MGASRRIAFAVTLCGVFTGTAWAYEAVQVSNGGTVKGKVALEATPLPKDEVIQITKDETVCGTSLPAERYLVAKSGEVQNVLVWIEGIERGKPLPQEGLVITNLNCAFVPHVSVTYLGGNVIFRNDDPVLHNVHLYLLPVRATYMNVALPQKGMERNKSLRKSGLYEIGCDAHAHMRGYLYVSNHPYAAVTGGDGGFTFTDVPPGDYTLKAWHEALGEVKTPVRVAPGVTSEVTVNYKK